MFKLQALFDLARCNPANPMNQPGRLMGRHCQARLQRAVAKRIKAKKTPFEPALGGQRGGDADHLTNHLFASQRR